MRSLAANGSEQPDDHTRLIRDLQALAEANAAVPVEPGASGLFFDGPNVPAAVPPAPTPTPSPTPTPTPTPSPTPTPLPGVISLSPNPAQIPSIPCSGYGTFTATEGGYSGTFTAQPADNLDVGVSGQAIGPGQELFSVNVDYFSGVATTITVTDSNGRSAVETLDVYTCGG